MTVHTKADQLRLAIAYALRDLKIQGRKGALSEADRYMIADAVITRLTQSGDSWNLHEEIPLFFHGPQKFGEP
jgi:hypothetical protein